MDVITLKHYRTYLQVFRTEKFENARNCQAVYGVPNNTDQNSAQLHRSVIPPPNKRGYGTPPTSTGPAWWAMIQTLPQNQYHLFKECK